MPEDRAPSPLPPRGYDISRPSSASTASSRTVHQLQHSNNFNISLPGLSTLASLASAVPSPQHRSLNNPIPGQSMNYATASPAATTTGGAGNVPPVCQNCSTSTTPLWRRDEIGSVLCNACGLFLKLHGRPRPISLKTDVIKSRNRVKSAGLQAQKKRSLTDNNGLSMGRSDYGTPPPSLSAPFPNHVGQRRVSHKSSGGSDRSPSPISRTATPLHHHQNIAPQHLFDGVSLTEHTFQHSPSLPSLHPMRQPSPGSTTSLLDRHLEPPHTYENLSQQNTHLKTRVSELEVINGLFKDRVEQLQRNATNDQMTNAQLRQALQDAENREHGLKRKIDDLERENADLRDPDALPPGKRLRHSDMSEYPDPPQPLSAGI